MLVRLILEKGNYITTLVVLSYFLMSQKQSRCRFSIYLQFDDSNIFIELEDKDLKESHHKQLEWGGFTKYCSV